MGNYSFSRAVRAPVTFLLVACWSTEALAQTVVLSPAAPTARSLTLESLQREAMFATDSAAAAGMLDSVVAGIGTVATTAAWNRAVHLTRDSTEAFQRMVRLGLDHPEALIRLARSGKGPIAAAVVLASTSADSLDAYLDSASATVSGGGERLTGEQKADVRSDWRELSRRLGEANEMLAGGLSASVFASGDIREVATAPSDKSTAGTGSLGVNATRGENSWTAQIAVASSIDSVSAGYGAAILRPGSGQAFSAGLFDWKRRRRFLVFNEFHTYVTAAKTDWLVKQADTTGAVPVAKGAVSLGGGALVGRRLVEGRVQGSDVGLRVELGVSFRWLTGDVGRDEQFRQMTLGSTDRFWWGAELGAEISVGYVLAAVQYFYYAGDADGLTDGQLVAAIGIHASILSGPVTP
jgi:hypothetical protein